jgi:hypothetical protein
MESLDYDFAIQKYTKNDFRYKIREEIHPNMLKARIRLIFLTVN